MGRENAETYQERVRAQMREEIEGEVRHEFAAQLVKALQPTLQRDPSIQIIVALIEDTA